MRMLRPPHRQARDSGYTLLETVLVLALIVAIAGLTWPALKGPMATQRLKRAAEAVRTEWVKARSKAITTGETLTFRYQAGSGQFDVQTYSTADGQLATGSKTMTTADGAQLLPSAMARARLPEGVVFLSDATASSEPRVAGFGATEDAGGWSDGILFYPDGTATNARVVVQGESGRQLAIELRGLTGTSSVGAIALAGDRAP
jgi:Tfp pilus assembly protein FimT